MSDINVEFSIITGATAHEIIFSDLNKIIEIIENTYIKHFKGETVNPNSHFLTFPENKTARIIALPAHINGDNPVSGIKWISSYPENIKNGLPRAFAVMILNDTATGYPFACLEASIISATRTAASAISALYNINNKGKSIDRLGIIGTGVIAGYMLEFLKVTGWEIKQIYVHDAALKYSQGFTKYASSKNRRIHIKDSVGDVIKNCKVTILSTTATTPYITDPTIFSHNPIILNISLRDLSPQIILAANNIVDNIEHVLKENTSLHLAQQVYGHSNFITTTLPEILATNKFYLSEKTTIFSPFGMGILDISLGQYIYQCAVKTGKATPIKNFFFETGHLQPKMGRSHD